MTKKPKTKSPKKTSHENTAIYKKNKKTGEWEVKNPSGSIAYNYLYRSDYEEDDTDDKPDLDEKDKNR